MMNNQLENKASYRDAVASLETALAAMDIYGQRDIRKRFTLFSANLQYFMPALALHKHESYFRALCLQQHLAHLDQSHPQALLEQEIRGMEALQKRILRPGPEIICTYHTGSYRLINRLLMQMQVPFALLVAADVLRDEEAAYRQIFRSLCPGAATENFQLINAQKPQALLQMLRLLNKGMKLLVYVDGNTGMGNTLHAKNTCEVAFFGKTVAARSGVGILSYLAGAPFISLLCKPLDKGILNFDLVELVAPDRSLKRADYVQDIMQQLYARLEICLRKQPAIWEGWLYMHHYVKFLGESAVFLPERC